jgi:hypothetical protein
MKYRDIVNISVFLSLDLFVLSYRHSIHQVHAQDEDAGQFTQDLLWILSLQLT